MLFHIYTSLLSRGAPGRPVLAWAIAAPDPPPPRVVLLNNCNCNCRVCMGRFVGENKHIFNLSCVLQAKYGCAFTCPGAPGPQFMRFYMSRRAWVAQSMRFYVSRRTWVAQTMRFHVSRRPCVVTKKRKHFSCIFTCPGASGL